MEDQAFVKKYFATVKVNKIKILPKEIVRVLIICSLFSGLVIVDEAKKTNIN